MNMFADDVDLVDDCAPMPGEIKPTLKSNPSGRTLVPLTHKKKQPMSETLVKNEGKVVKTPSGALQIGKTDLGATVFAIPKKVVKQQAQNSKRMNASSFMQQPRIPRSFLVDGDPSNTQGGDQVNTHPTLAAPAGVPKSFLTPEHQKQISQIPQWVSAADTKKSFRQNTRNQTKPNTPTNQSNAGFKQSFQPVVEPQQQPQDSQISVNLRKSGSENTPVTATDSQESSNSTDATKPKQGKLTKKQKKLMWEMKNEKQAQKTSANTTDYQGYKKSTGAKNPLTRKERLRQKKKIMTWTKADTRKEDGEIWLSEDTSGKTKLAPKLTRKMRRRQIRLMKFELRKRYAEALSVEQFETSTTGETQETTSTAQEMPQQTTMWPQQTITEEPSIMHQQNFAQQQPIIPQQQPIIPQYTITQQQPIMQQENIMPQQTITPQQTVTSPEGNEPRQVYSPSDVYDEKANVESDGEENDENTDGSTPGSKRLSAFRRLGPVTQPKKPKMTINWLCNKDVRQVVETVEDEDVPVHLRKYIQMSTDDIVLRYLPRWPWVNPPPVRRTVCSRQSKSVMILEQEQMEDMYKKDNTFFQISITGYPDTWTKEDVLDTVLESVKGNSFIPCFIEHSKSECKFLVIRSRLALLHFHKVGFVIKKDDVTLHIIISVINFTVSVLEFVPRLILMKRLANALTETELDLKAFTLEKDVSHFIYFPLDRVTNQVELLKLQSSVQWELLTKLDLSSNKLTNLNGFFLKISTPKLKHLNLSNNLLDKISCLFNCRNLPLKSIALEGNPLCNDYIEQDHYIKVLKMLFTELVEIDGINIIKTSDMPTIKQNYCTEEAGPIIERVLEVFFPLLETSPGERLMIQDMYDDNAILTITHMPRLRYSPIYLDFRSLFKYARILEEDEHLCIKGASSIAKVLCKWPQMEHDPYTFSVDLMYHMDTTIIFRVGGLFKLTSDSLAEDEPLLYFTRTFVLNTRDGVEYKINNEMVYWELPSKDSVKAAFKSTSVWKRQPNLKLESPPDEELKENLLQIFMNLTHMERQPSIKCLELKQWHLRNALDYFVNLLKLDNLDPIMK